MSRINETRRERKEDEGIIQEQMKWQMKEEINKEKKQSNRSYIFYFLFAQSVQITSACLSLYDELSILAYLL